MVIYRVSCPSCRRRSNEPGHAHPAAKAGFPRNGATGLPTVPQPQHGRATRPTTWLPVAVHEAFEVEFTSTSL